MAFGKIGISVDSAGRVTMHFLTCSATLPDTLGLHVVPTACGSGKSTDIAEIAVKKKSGGVLIIVPTKKEADEMGARIGRLGSVSMPDIEVLHCQNGPAIGKYRSDPWSLSKKPILILTSVRPQIDPLILFLSYNGGIRELVLIDELINFFPEPFKVPEGLYETLTFVDKNKTHGGRKAIETKVIGSTTFYRHIYQDKDEMEAAFSLAGKNIRKLLPDKSELDKVKRGVIFEHVRDHGFSEIQQKVLDMAKVTNVCLFDGSADLLFPKSDPRLVPITGDRYNSDIQFHIFPCRMKRKELEDCQESDVLRLAPEFIDLVRVKSQTEKVLVICWKTVGGKINPSTDKASGYEGLEDTAVSFPGILRRALISAGGKDENIYITYRGSGQDRGSNEYKDTSAVVFLGEWRLPEEPITGQISETFGLKMKFWDYKKSLLVQTICRSRIRQHQGLPIEVYFSEDINYQMAWEVQEYFKANSSPSCKIGGLLKPCRILSKPDKGNLYDLTRLYSYDPKIRSAIESGTSYRFTIHHDTLFKLIPWRLPRKSRFSGLQALLDTYNITMTIA
ncbi:MAG: hypothetical protein IJL91_08190 [Bacteroidales bacterium]|nr:hypothetical protein [Bacteroidales bacterium]